MTHLNLNSDALSEVEKQPHVLVIDDDERLRELLSQFLTEHGLLVTVAENAKAAREVLAYLSYDLIICDVMMPGEDGMALTRGLKNDGLSTPVLLLTALGETESRISGLEAGADDYLSKPFEPRELLLRVQAILRRVGSTPPASKSKDIKFGKWQLDLARGELTDGAERLPLTSVEHTLLKALAEHAGEVVSRETLADLCGLSGNERTIDVQVTRLRKKIEEDQKLPKYIQTVRGRGYVLWSD